MFFCVAETMLSPVTHFHFHVDIMGDIKLEILRWWHGACCCSSLAFGFIYLLFLRVSTDIWNVMNKNIQPSHMARSCELVSLIIHKLKPILILFSILNWPFYLVIHLKWWKKSSKPHVKLKARGLNPARHLVLCGPPEFNMHVGCFKFCFICIFLEIVVAICSNAKYLIRSFSQR